MYFRVLFFTQWVNPDDWFHDLLCVHCPGPNSSAGQPGGVDSLFHIHCHLPISGSLLLPQTTEVFRRRYWRYLGSRQKPHNFTLSGCTHFCEKDPGCVCFTTSTAKGCLQSSKRTTVFGCRVCSRSQGQNMKVICDWVFVLADRPLSGEIDRVWYVALPVLRWY